NNPSTGMPTNILLFPRAVDPNAGPGQALFGKFDSTGPFAASTAPFQPDGDGTFKKDMRLSLPLDRLDDRRALLKGFDQLKRGMEAEAEQMDAGRLKAFSILLGGIGEAFDLKNEDVKTIEQYETAHLFNVETIDKKWNNHKHYADNA